MAKKGIKKYYREVDEKNILNEGQKHGASVRQSLTDAICIRFHKALLRLLNALMAYTVTSGGPPIFHVGVFILTDRYWRPRSDRRLIEVWHGIEPATYPACFREYFKSLHATRVTILNMLELFVWNRTTSSLVFFLVSHRSFVTNRIADLWLALSFTYFPRRSITSNIQPLFWHTPQ